jgi:branched-chain amino acid transport system substrate-binding protein
VARDDAGNKGLQTSTGTSFTTKGGEVQALTPYSASTPDFASVITGLKAKVAQLTTTHGAGKVGVYLASFDECVALFKLANAEPSLKAVNGLVAMA